jgi:Cu/Zn superoxide dismutase
MPRDAAGKAGDARGDEARKAGKAATTTNASTTTTSSTPGQAPVVHESQDTYISQLSRSITC